jgi:hypothetical protein
MTITEIPKIVINLPERTDRLELVKKELAGIEFILMPGVSNIKPMVGIGQAHINAVLIAKQNEWPSVLIIEDDLSLRKGSIPYLEEALKNVPEDWEILLGGIYEGRLKKVNDYWASVGEFCGLHFYIVNSNAYDKVLTYDFKHHIDRWMNLRGERLKCYVLNKFVATQWDGFSDNIKKESKYSDKLKKFSLL